MKKHGLTVIAPKYNDEITIDVQGDYNDGDYTYDTIRMSLPVYEIAMPILIECSGSHNWENKDRVELGIEALKEKGIEEDSEFWDDVLGTLEEIHLYSDWGGGCHSMYIQSVHLESKDDNTRYEVKWN